MTSRSKPRPGQIKISLESGANIHSSNDIFVEYDDLGYTEEEWNQLDDDEKFKAVEEYFLNSGYPEFSWEEG